MYLKRIEKLFPDVILHNITEDVSKLFVELETSVEWNENTARAFQSVVLDRKPEAVGGPFDFTCEKDGETFIVKWNCYNIAGY